MGPQNTYGPKGDPFFKRLQLTRLHEALLAIETNRRLLLCQRETKASATGAKLLVFQDVFPHLERNRGHNGLAAGEIGEVSGD